jgi:uncharacterized protein
MDVRTVDDPLVFLEQVRPFLLDDEARHNLMLGILATLVEDPARYPDFGLWLVTDGREILGAAARTRPFNLILARPRRREALDALVAALDEELPGVVGALPEVVAFADAWSESREVVARQRFAQGVFALERVDPIPPVPGRMRAAIADDAPLLLDWLRAFTIEALYEEEPDEARLTTTVEYRLRSEAAGFVLWEDDRPVSLAGFGGPTPSGVRVGPVYTPPELRGRGYASALVAELSSRLLASGRRCCFLYTDLANPTSNKIYERIGYRRICDSAEITFAPS